jgi:hypothetical protein
MAFTIAYAGGSRDFYDDDCQLVVRDSGILEVTKDGEQVKLYGPSYWDTVEPGVRRKMGSPGRIR